MKKNLNFIKQFLKFSIIGLINTILNLLITYCIIFIFKNSNINNVKLTFFANFCGFIITTFNAYYLNNKFVFKKTKNVSLIPLIKTFLCYGSTFILSFILTKILTEWFNLSVFFVPILSIFITTPSNFLINKFWSFA